MKCLPESDELLPFGTNAAPRSSYSSNPTDGGVLFLTIKDSHCMRTNLNFSADLSIAS